MSNQEEEVRTDQKADVSITVSYARPKMVLKDYRSSEIKLYDVQKVEVIQINGQDAGLRIEANEVTGAEVEQIDPEEALEVEMRE